jgi:hypothetical protein
MHHHRVDPSHQRLQPSPEITSLLLRDIGLAARAVAVGAPALERIAVTRHADAPDPHDRGAMSPVRQ